jgi:hypothetical protein
MARPGVALRTTRLRENWRRSRSSTSGLAPGSRGKGGRRLILSSAPLAAKRSIGSHVAEGRWRTGRDRKEKLQWFLVLGAKQPERKVVRWITRPPWNDATKT